MNCFYFSWTIFVHDLNNYCKYIKIFKAQQNLFELSIESSSVFLHWNLTEKPHNILRT